MQGLFAKLVFLAVSAGLVREACRWWKRVSLSARSRGWPRVEGTIERSELFLKISRARVGRAGRWSPNSGYYLPLVHFAYEVRGRRYTGDVITFGKEPIYSSFPARAREKCREYPEGSTVHVYFDPASPATACLERGEGSLALGYALAVGIALLGVLALSGVVLS
jgi:hypothetical protein